MRVQSGLEREGMGHFSSKMRVDTALTVDGVTLFGKALREVRQFHNFSAVSLTCNSTDTWKFGESIIAYMKAVTPQRPMEIKICEYLGVLGYLWWPFGKGQIRLERDSDWCPSECPRATRRRADENRNMEFFRRFQDPTNWERRGGLQRKHCC